MIGEDGHGWSVLPVDGKPLVGWQVTTMPLMAGVAGVILSGVNGVKQLFPNKEEKEMPRAPGGRRPEDQKQITVAIHEPKLVKTMVTHRKHLEALVGCRLSWAQVIESLFKDLMIRGELGGQGDE